MRPSQPFGERIVVVVVNGFANIGRLVWDLMRKKLEWPNYLQSDRADPDGDRKGWRRWKESEDGTDSHQSVLL